jgi:hypothetical protein
MSTPSQRPSVCSEPLLFSFNDLGSRQVIADFSAGYLSSDGGMLLLRQIDEVWASLGPWPAAFTMHVMRS